MGLLGCLPPAAAIAVHDCASPLPLHKERNMLITLQDICWLRLAARKTGTVSIPSAAAARLVGAQLIRADSNQGCMRITKRGELALVRLG